MSTPRERLEKIIAAVTPCKVVFINAAIHPGVVYLDSKIVKPRQVQELPEDKQLQDAADHLIREYWDSDAGKYYISADAQTLYGDITRKVLSEYERVSGRSSATRRKTEQFVKQIRLDDKHLSNYILQVFVTMHSPTYAAMILQENQAVFEPLEALRRTYGKRF